MDEQAYQELLKRYLKGDVTPEERMQLDAWYDALGDEARAAVPETEQEMRMQEKWEELQGGLILVPKKRALWMYAAAASVAAIVFVSFIWFNRRVPVRHKYEIAGAIRESGSHKKRNDSDHVMELVLSDKSTVRLEPGASIQYPEVFTGARREVILEGVAFFQVTKDPARPFIVYAGDVITKVLGTSFTVRADKGGKDVTVAVKTGRVSVFSTQLATKSSTYGDPETQGVVLTPNQQVVFVARESRLVKTLVERPDLVVPPLEEPRFTFDNVPVSEIFKSLEKSYGVAIMYDEALLANCRVTTTMENEGLYEKLNIICTLLNASYKVIDAQIVIDTKGC